MIKIDRKIVGWRIKPAASLSADQPAAAAHANREVVQMHERLERPEVLVGSTYKIKTPLSEHALYVTINDVLLNEGTEHELRRPFEIFINSKNMEHFQWIVALTRIISAVFRKGGDVTFLVEELHSVFDPRGGYFKRGGKYMPSLVAEIGDAIESHLRSIGMLDAKPLDAAQQQYVDERRAAHEQRSPSGAPHPLDAAATQADDANDFPPGAQLCVRCRHKAVVMLEGCMTCLNCAESKCS